VIDLLRDASWLILAWCIGLTLTYGVVESALMMPVRIWLSSESLVLEELVHCPVCSGFWCQTIAWWIVLWVAWGEPRGVLIGGCVGTALLLWARASGVELVRSRFEAEKGAIAAVRERRCAMGESEAICVCAGCDRVLLEKTVVAQTTMPDGSPATVSEYRARPWAASVLSRTRIIPMSPDADPKIIEIREVPMICSRLCFAKIVASYTHRTGAAMAMVYTPTMKEGDDYLAHVLGSRGPLPDEPSDDWVDPHERDDERRAAS